jgi:hypothetical protein
MLKVGDVVSTGRSPGLRGSTALTLCAALVVSVVAMLGVADAGGRRHVSPGPHGRVGPPAHRNVTIRTEVPRKSAFGSPGGYPYPYEIPYDTARHRVARVIPHRIAHHPHHRVFTWFAPPGALYSPGIQYVVAEAPAPPVGTVSPVIYAAPAGYVSPPPVDQPAAAVATPAESPVPRVVEHATGRYELRGDGTTTPYQWVWIPHPPSAPPEAAPPSTREPGATDRMPSYRWTGEDGTIFLTNRLDRVPESHRAQARGTPQ